MREMITKFLPLKEVIKKIKPEKLSDLSEFLSEFSFVLSSFVNETNKTIRDIKDQPIMNSAINADVDVILKGDKDFLFL